MSDSKNNLQERLRQIVKDAILQEMGEAGAEGSEGPKARPVHAIIVDIAKAGSIGMKAMAAVKQKKMPTKKSADAVAASVDALRAVFADMLRNPTNYLDTGKPSDVVAARVQTLADREDQLRDHDGAGGSPLAEEDGK